MAIGIIGLGYVGKATAAVFASTKPWVAYDTKSGCWQGFPEVPELRPAVLGDRDRANPLGWLVREATEAIFVCVPTPMKPDGSCDTSIVENVVRAIGTMTWPARIARTVVIKSTVPPGTTVTLAQRWPQLTLVFCPEFLREQTALEDARSERRVLIGKGCPDQDSGPLKECYAHALPHAIILITDSTTAEMVKYATNVFLATKVSLANELCEICTALGIDYQSMITLAVGDQRLGESHWQVPGPDLHVGWGGSCLPKDVNALIHRAR